jgi:thymidylate synthase
MRIFQSAVEAVKEVERDLYEMGHRGNTKSYQDKISDEGFNNREMVGYSFTLIDGSDWRDSFQALGFQDSEECIHYVENEVHARIHPPPHHVANPGHSWTYRPKVWEQFLEGPDKDQFSYTYPERIGNQVHRALQIHDSDPENRQLVIPIYNKNLDDSCRGGARRVPCTMHFQILHRDKAVYFIHNMRSCDLYTHFPIDMSISWLMGEYFQQHWGAECTRLIMQMGSLHAFEKDMKVRGIF